MSHQDCIMSHLKIDQTTIYYHQDHLNKI